MLMHAMAFYLVAIRSYFDNDNADEQSSFVVTFLCAREEKKNELYLI